MDYIIYREALAVFIERARVAGCELVPNDGVTNYLTLE